MKLDHKHIAGILSSEPVDLRTENAELRAEADRLTATPCIPWRHHSEHGDTFEDGEKMMVAVHVRNNRTGQCYWEIGCVFAAVDDTEGTCTLEPMYDGYWGWSWCDVEWWMPMSELLGTLPWPEAANAAERGEG